MKQTKTSFYHVKWSSFVSLDSLKLHELHFHQTLILPLLLWMPILCGTWMKTRGNYVNYEVQHKQNKM